jgi:predicted RNA-binding protein with EMAP domain
MSTEVLDVPQAQSEGNEEKDQGAQGTTLDLIRAKVENPNYPAWKLMRLVTLEIATVVQEMRQLGFTVEEVYILRCLGEIIKALRELRHSIMDTESLRKRADVINFEGEAIKHVVDTLVDWFVEALKEAGLDEEERNIVMRNYRDLALLNEDQLRRETEAFGG